MSTEEEERLKRDEFIEFIQLHEILLQKRTVQDSLNKEKKDPKERKSNERAFHTRETKLDRKKRIKDEERKSKAQQEGALPGGNDGAAYSCPLCQAEGGHPIKAGPRAGQSRKTLARCEIMKSTPQNKKLELLLKHKSCSRCMQTTHQVTDCKVDENASWLTHPECPKKHNPLVCPLKKVENSMATRTSTCSGDSDLGLPVAEDSHADADLIINLAEKAEVRDAAGRMHSVTAVHDHCSDSSWISSSLARSLPPTKRRRVTVPLHTIQGTTPFRTWQYHLQILVNNEYKSIKVYESPDIGTVQYDSALPSFLKKVFGCPIHLPEGSVDLLIGIREHALSPDTLAIKPAHGTVEAPNLKIYQSSLVPARRLICGSISSALIGGGASARTDHVHSVGLHKDNYPG